MFNALGGLGGGGKADATLADQMVIIFFFLLPWENREDNGAEMETDRSRDIEPHPV
jgi:hypothetical protein